MNPFEQHSVNMQAYLAEMAEPVSTAPPGSKPNTIDYAGNNYPATVGDFMLIQILTDGGWSKHLQGEVIVQKSSLPAGVAFHTGHLITANQIGGSSRNCMIQSINDTFLEYRLTLWDQDQAA